MPTTGELFLSHSINKLKQMTALVEASFQKLDADQIWNRGGDTQNSIGNLVMHLSGNVRQWIGWSVGGLPDIRRRDEEFAAGTAIAPAELLSNLMNTVEEALAILENLPVDRLTERVPTQNGERTVLEVIYQVVGHFQQHTGQIIFAEKKFLTLPLRQA
jgi:hypothetical protein